ncbi:MAG: hypothetical protein EBZ95_13220 [Chitinophagia bacterium]|nr:hypothetical protein [Chitinophagia bacterium]
MEILTVVAPNKETLFRNHWKEVAVELVDKFDPFQLITGLDKEDFKVTTVEREPVLQPTELVTESL